MKRLKQYEQILLWLQPGDGADKNILRGKASFVSCREMPRSKTLTIDAVGYCYNLAARDPNLFA